MKIIITYLLLLNTFMLGAQQPLDTIYANTEKNVALFFPNPIRQGITGADHFVFTYNREKEQYFGLIQAQPGSESNLLAVTNNGTVYSYILKYADSLPKLNYFITQKESIGNEIPKIKVKAKEQKRSHPIKYRLAYFKRACTYMLNSNYETLASIRNNGIRLQVQKMKYDGSEVYLTLEIKNASGINFEIDYLNFYKTNGNNRRKSSYQSLQQELIYTHEMPSSILNNQSSRFVCVLPKFVLGNNEKLSIELKELKGDRKVVLNTDF